MTLVVGQKLWYVPSDKRGQPHAVTVLKVGRKWADLDYARRRISIKTLRADGGQYSSPGRCYLSQAEYEAEVALDKAWTKFRDLVYHRSRKPDIRISQIENAARALFGASILTR